MEMDFSHWFLLLYAVVVFYNLGVVWFAQVVIYPLFGQVGSAEYRAYHPFYSSRIWLPVIIPGFACFLLPVALVFLRPDTVAQGLALANAACGIVALLVTVALEIPRHARLEKGGKQGEVIRELILYNWPRTLAITRSLHTRLIKAPLTTGRWRFACRSNSWQAPGIHHPGRLVPEKAPSRQLVNRGNCSP
jgi:hypothetical protein